MIPESGLSPSNASTPRGILVMPDNRCCFCLNLRVGTIIVGVANVLINILGFIWYATSPSVKSSFTYPDSRFTDLDLSVMVIFLIQVLADFSLIYGALMRSPIRIVPWLCANAIIMGLLLGLVAMLLFLGYIRLSLAYDEYVALLSLVGLLSAGHLFSCMVVFQFRRNLIDEKRIRRLNGEFVDDQIGSPRRPSSAFAPRAPSPPPTYEEVSKHKKTNDANEAPPPDYNVAVPEAKEK